MNEPMNEAEYKAWLNSFNEYSDDEANTYLMADMQAKTPEIAETNDTMESIVTDANTLIEKIDAQLRVISKKMLPSLGILEKKRLEKAYDTLLDQRSKLTSL